jgi:Trk K+ transport system NAD-binding subunit
LVAAFAIKIVSALVFRFAYSWSESISSGMLLSARLSLIIAASSIGVRLGAISESTNAAIILIAALTAMFAPLGFNSLMAEPDEKKRRAKLIYGGSELALQVGKELRAHGDEVYFIELDPEGARRVAEQDFVILHEGGSVSAIMESIPDIYVDAFIALNSSDDNNLDACRVARAHGVEHILSFVAEPIRIPDFRGLGVQTLTPSLHRSSLLALMARNSAIFSLMTATDDQRDMREFIVFNSSLHGKRLMDLRFPPEVLVLAIRRADELLIPHGTTKIETGDHLTILGNLDSLPELEQLLEKW